MHNRRTRVETSPLFVNGELHEFTVQGRWPLDTAEWTQFLVHAVRTACTPGTVQTVSPVFRVVEDAPDTGPFEAIEVVVFEGSVVGDDAIGPEHLGLDHRAAWVQTDTEGTVTRLVSQSDLDPMTDVDTAALASLLAA